MSQLFAPDHLRCEYQTEPLGMEETTPRLSWQVRDGRRDARQTAYQVFVASTSAKLRADDADVWDSGKTAGDQSVHVVYGGAKLRSGRRYWWKACTWDAAGQASPWSAPTWWEMGLLDRSEWKGRWIGSSLVGGPRASVPCPYLRRAFVMNKPIASARLYVTALGLYECHINGRRVGDDVFTPGWTDYDKRVQYQTYDVADLLRAGDNAIGAILGDGWACGHVAWTARQNYVERPRLLAQLAVAFADGSTQVIATDESWKTTTGPIIESDMLMGESYDSRLEMDGWAEASFDDAAWQRVKCFEDTGVAIEASASPRVRRVMELKSCVSPQATTHNRIIYDMGQNFAGRVRLKVRGERGLTIRIRHAEMLNADGTLYTDNLRAARVTDYYTLKGGGEETYEPRFTFHGFRYVELENRNKLPAREDIEVTGIVLQSDTPATGTFECGNPLINQLQHNIQWGQRGNFLEAPTDCPQRDERLGWTGDAQVFVRTACFNMDVSGFFTKWTQDLRDAQAEAGSYPMVAPNKGFTGADGGPAWAEAGVICPWTIYQCYGDRRILERHYDSMVRFIDFLKSTSDQLIRPAQREGLFGGFGDWLATDAPNPGAAPTPKRLIGTAYFARSVQLLARIAAIIGRDADAARYQKLWTEIKTAFNEEFVTQRGLVGGNTQTSYLLALGFDLIDDDRKPRVIDHMIHAFKAANWHLATGFVGTPLIAPVLTACGKTDVAYRILLQQTYPGWLYTVLQGATTMWERWNSWTRDKGFGDPGMNSFNHYAYGCIGQWLYATVAGIDLDDSDPGYHHIIVKPTPGGELTYAKASLQSQYGPIATHWQLTADRFTLELTVPANTRATVHLPTTDIRNVTETSQPLAQAPGVHHVHAENNRIICEVGAGTYRFEVKQ
ncbi:MAG: glycoside hydrolase family 78 protein [Phycisphaerales bacterium]